MYRRRRYPRVKSAVALAAFAFLIAACGGSEEPEDAAATPDASTDQEADADTDADADASDDLAAMLPEEIRERGYLTAVTDASQPPYEFIDDSGEIVGMDPEIGQAIAEVLGLELEIETTDFGGVIPAVTSKRYDMSLIAMFDTPERQEQVDFVDYYIDGDQVIVPAGNPNDIASIDDFCGLTISTLQGSVMFDLLEDHQPECGDDPMEITVAATTAEQLLWLSTGRADATIANGTVTQYTIDNREAEGIEVVPGELYVRNYYGYGFRKDDTDLRDAVEAALNVLIEDGTYEEIVTKWGGTPDNLIPEAIVNGGGSL